jgi:nitroreductase
MAAEDVVLWLAEEGVGTCWLGGVNDKEIRAALGLGAEMSVPAIVSFGKPKAPVRSGGYDSFVYLSLSRRRKPLSEIAFNEKATNPYGLRDVTGEPFSASAEQKIRPLLEKILGGPPRGSKAPLELVIDACLESARIAPNAGNAQKWQFIAVEDSGNLGKLRTACGSAENWRAAIVSAGSTKKIEAGLLDKPFWMVDAPIALSHMSLMAASMGCGVEVLTDGIDEDSINEMAGLRHDMRTAGVLGII